MNLKYNIPGTGLYDDFSTLKPGWRTGDVADYDRIGVDSGAVRDLDPYSRRGVMTSPPYETIVDPENAVHPPVDGTIHHGIGFYGRDMGTWRPDVEITWSGLWDIHEGHHIEVTPRLWIDDENTLAGFGAWPITILYDESSPGVPTFVIGFIGSPPEIFGSPTAPLIGSVAFSHTDGVPRKIRLRVNESDVVQLLLDDVVIWSRALSHASFTSLSDFATLQQSTVHGLAIDAHLVRPISSIPDLDGALDIRFHNWPS